MNISINPPRLRTGFHLVSLPLVIATLPFGARAATPGFQCQPATLNIGLTKEIPTLVFCRTDSLIDESAQPITAQKLLD